jgi:hypothetical protein
MIRIKFDPVQVGKLEVGWWKAHNNKDRELMYKLLVEQHMALYGFSEEEAKEALGYFIKGVKFHDSRDWNKAIEAVKDYYQIIKSKLDLNFEVAVLAKLEINWWQLHDELEDNPNKIRLAETFADLYSAEFGFERLDMLDAGKLKAQATHEHDLAEEDGIGIKMVNKHWDDAERLLIEFYKELDKVVNEK